MAKARGWGFWTEQKLQMLADYLPAFTTAAKYKAGGTTIYLDLFAGDIRNWSRTTGEQISGSPRVALDTAPAFSKVVLFELPTYAARLEGDLRAEYPGRDLTVWAGNCNDKIDDALAQLEQLRWAPTFAFIDQYAAEVRWTTLEKVANFKRGSKYKAEQWLLFAHSMLPRGLACEDPHAGADFEARIDAMYGCHDWIEAYEARKAELLTPSELREELVNLMRWRMENVLGYAFTHSFEMKNTRGQPIYTMLFATDNDAGDTIMSSVYRKAAERQPEMRAQALAVQQALREEKSGHVGLFEPLVRPVRPGERASYVHEPPREPYRRSV